MTEPPEGAPPKWYYSIWFVIVSLFFILGPFGLPLLWKSPLFHRWSKIALTTAVLLYTVFLIVLTKQAVEAVLKQIDQLQKVLQ